MSHCGPIRLKEGTNKGGKNQSGEGRENDPFPSTYPHAANPVSTWSGFRSLLPFFRPNSPINHLQPFPQPPLDHSRPRSKGFRSKFARNFSGALEVLDDDPAISASCTTHHHPQSNPFGPRNKTQLVVGRWNTEEEESKLTISRVFDGCKLIWGLFRPKIGLGHMYKTCSPHQDLHSGKI
ncbi:hypothetical protein ACFX19_025870 [Malus domestica]